DFPTDTVFNSVTFSGSDYAVAAESNRLNLGFGGITSSATSGTNSYDGPIRLDDSRTMQVAAGGALRLGGVVSGIGGIRKTGPGALTLDGTGDNTYTDATQVFEGQLQLDKNGLAIRGPLLLSSEVRLLRANQIADN